MLQNGLEELKTAYSLMYRRASWFVYWI